jgi:hypothetical protein
VSLSPISGGKAGRLRCKEISHVGRERRREGETSFEFERQGGGVQGLAGKKKFSFQSRSPIRLDELQVTIFVRAVDFVADNWVSDVCEMYANLVGSAGFRFDFYEGELLFLLVLEPVQDPERSKGWITVGVDCLLQPDPGWQNGSLPQERLIHDVRFFRGPAEDDGAIGFADAMLSNHEA